jgi:hypothetical protein
MMSAEANSMFETLHRARLRGVVPVEVLGDVSDFVTSNGSVSGLLLQATLTPDESANDSAESRPPAS